MDDPVTASDVGILAAHAYVTSTAAPWNYPNRTTQLVWQTEVSDTGTYDGTMTNGLTYALGIHNWLTTAKVNAWHYWELSGQRYSDNEGLTSGTNVFAKRAYVIGNWARFATGMSEISATANPQPGIFVTAFLNLTSGASVIVAINTQSTAASQTFSESGLTASYVTPYITDPSTNLAPQAPIPVSSGSFTATLTGSSVTSFVAPALNSEPAQLSEFYCRNATVLGPATDVCTVKLSSSTSAGATTVSLSSNSTAVTLPATVTLPVNTATVQFTASVASVQIAQTVTLKASSGGVSETFALQLDPAS